MSNTSTQIYMYIYIYIYDCETNTDIKHFNNYRTDVPILHKNSSLWDTNQPLLREPVGYWFYALSLAYLMVKALHVYVG